VPALPLPLQGERVGVRGSLRESLAQRLAIECGVSTIDGRHAVFRQFFPDENIPPRAEMQLEQLAEGIDAKLR
jgi:hypothetical protein